MISSSWGGQGHLVHVYLEQAEIPGRTCRYEPLPFQREKAGSSGFLIPLHCFWIYSQTLPWITCSASGYCFCRIWFYIQGAEEPFYPFLGQNTSETQRKGQEQELDQIIWAMSGPWWSVVHPDLIRQHLNLRLQKAKRLYHLSTAIECPRLKGETAWLPIGLLTLLLHYFKWGLVFMERLFQNKIVYQLATLEYLTL